MNVSHTQQTQSATVSAYAPVRAVIVETDGSARVEDLQPSESGSLLRVLQDAVGGLIDVAALGEGLDMYVHDEGFYVCDPNPVATVIAHVTGGREQPFFGPAVFTGGVDAEGLDTSIADEVADEIVGFAAEITARPEFMACVAARALKAVGR